MSLPRLTQALRAFAGVSPKLNDPSSDDNDDLVFKHKLQAERRLKDTVSWSQLTLLVQNGVLSERKACFAKLQQLLSIAREIGMWCINSLFIYFNYAFKYSLFRLH